MSKIYEYIPTLSITPDTQEHRMSAARFIPAILGRRKLIVYEHRELGNGVLKEVVSDDSEPVRALTTAQKQRGITLEHIDTPKKSSKKLPDLSTARFFKVDEDLDSDDLSDLYYSVLHSCDRVPTVEGGRSRIRVWMESTMKRDDDIEMTLELSPLPFAPEHQHFLNISTTIRNSKVSEFAVYRERLTDAELNTLLCRGEAARRARDSIISNARGALKGFRTGYVTNLDTHAVTDASEQEILKALSKKSEIADKITQPSWSKSVPENVSNVIVSLALKKTSDEPLKVEMLKKRRVDDFDNTIEKSLKFLGTPDTPEVKTVTGRLSDSPVGFRIYNKDQELVAFYDLRIRDNVPNANGIWFPVAGFKRDPEVTPENTPRWTNEAKLAALNTMYGGQTAAQRRALLDSALEQGHYVSERGVKFSNAVLEAMRQAAGEEPIRAFDAEGYYNL